MKFYAAFVLVLILVGAVLANKDGDSQKVDSKNKWRLKKEKHLLSLGKSVDDLKENRMESHKGRIDLDNPIEYKGADEHTLEHYFAKKKVPLYKKYKKNSPRAKKAKKAMAWLHMRTDMECDFKCKPGEVCISGPVVDKHICVLKKDLKKSMKTFHRYHKKEMKDWRKYQKKYYKKDWKSKEEKYGKEVKKMAKEMKKYEKEAKKMNKQNKHAMKKEKSQKLGKKHHYEGKFHKKAKPHFNTHPRTDEKGCGTSDMIQMKTRLMGWFHLLHGQDHEARKAHGGSIGKFHKHVSVKKELRENNGEKCQCMKSAMWQFHQMDKNQDDHLTDTELEMLEENSLEPCMRPYLDTCDKDGDKKISSNEWCCCFTNFLPPCYKQLDEIRKSGETVTYMPRCDKEGYFMHEQCKGGSSDVPLTCWCVDYNGNEFKDTAKQGRAHCHKITKYGDKKMVPLV